jgi:hypothetical protein
VSLLEVPLILFDATVSTARKQSKRDGLNRSDRDEISLIRNRNIMFGNQIRLSSANHHQGRRLYWPAEWAGYKTAGLPVLSSKKLLVSDEASI